MNDLQIVLTGERAEKYLQALQESATLKNEIEQLKLRLEKYEPTSPEQVYQNKIEALRQDYLDKKIELSKAVNGIRSLTGRNLESTRKYLNTGVWA